MKAYAIRCDTPALSVMAQKILFKKGYSWTSGKQLRGTEGGQYLILRGKRITFLFFDQWNNRDRSDLTLIGFSELVKL